MAQIWQRTDPTETKIFARRTIVSKSFKDPFGNTFKWGTHYPEGDLAVATIALTMDYKVVIFSQFRAGPELVMEELPGGTTELGKDLKSEASRELEEETGYVPGEMESLGKLCCDAYDNSWRNYFLATNCRLGKSGQKLDLEEASGEVKLITIDQLFNNAKSGKMTDSGAILLAYDKLLKLKEQSKT